MTETERGCVVWWITDESRSLSVSLVSGSVISMFVRLPCGGIGVSRNRNPVCLKNLFIICASLKESFWVVSCLWRWTVTLSGMKSTRRAQRVWLLVLWSNSSSKWHQESWRSRLPLSFAFFFFFLCMCVCIIWLTKSAVFLPSLQNGFAVVRPPGHHAEESTPMWDAPLHLCHSFLSSFICQ